MKPKHSEEEPSSRQLGSFAAGLLWGMGVSLVGAALTYLLVLFLMGSRSGEVTGGGGHSLNVIAPLYLLIVLGCPFLLAKRFPFNEMRGLLGYWIGAALMWGIVLLVVGVLLA